jgi:uncharacterized protein YidB (DUF937 family)
MATNLVSQIIEAVGPTIVSRIASSLGFDQAVTQKAINAAIPGLLAALIWTEQPVGVTGEAPYAGLLNKLRGIKVGDVDIGELATSAVNDAYTSLSGIKDEATAQSAVSGLTKATSEFDQLDGLLNQLTPETRKTVAEIFASIRPNLAQLMDRVLAIPGVGAIIEPAVDAINAKLDALKA